MLPYQDITSVGELYGKRKSTNAQKKVMERSNVPKRKDSRWDIVTNRCWLPGQSKAFNANRKSSNAVLRSWFPVIELYVQYAVDSKDESFDSINDFIFPIY